MAFTASYTVQQSGDSTSLIITDTSSYTSEPTSGFTGRRLYLYKTDGTTYVPAGTTTAYIDFNYTTYASGVITIPGFTNDLSLRIQLDCIKTVPVSGSTYTFSSIVAMVGYTNAGIYNAAQIAATNPSRISDRVYFDSLRELQREKVTAINAGTYGDQFAAQAALDRANNIINEANIRF